MEARKAFKIIEFGEIKISSIGNRYRSTMLKNLHNELKMKFNIYENEHSILWRGIDQNTFNEMKFLGEIMKVKVTENMIKASGKKIDDFTLQIGQEIKLLIWHGDGMENWPEEQQIIESFIKQCWKYQKYYPKE